MTVRPRPRFEDYPTVEDYSLAFHTWRALERDDRMTRDELTARFTALGWTPPVDWHWEGTA